MNRKGGVWLTIVIAFLAFTMVAIIALTAFLVIPGKEIKPYAETIGSDTRKADIYLNTISQISFLRGKAPGQETAAELIVSAYRKRDEESFRKLDEAAREYLKIYSDECVTLDVWDSNKKLVWPGPQSEGCKTSGTAAFINPLFETDITIPTDNPSEYLTVKQKSIYTPT